MLTHVNFDNQNLALKDKEQFHSVINFYDKILLIHDLFILSENKLK